MRGQDTAKPTAAQLRARAEARQRHEASKARVAAVCECPRRIWAAPGTFTAGDIMCTACGVTDQAVVTISPSIRLTDIRKPSPCQAMSPWRI